VPRLKILRSFGRLVNAVRIMNHCASSVLAIVVYLLIFVSSGATAQQARAGARNSTTALHTAAARNPSDTLAFKLFLKRLPVVSILEPNGPKTYFVYGGDLLLSRNEIRKHLRFHQANAEYDPCLKVQDDVSTYHLEACLARRPYIRWRGSGPKYYIFYLFRDQVLSLYERHPDIIKKSRQIAIKHKGAQSFPDKLSGLRVERVKDKLKYAIYARCDDIGQKEKCSEVFNVLGIKRSSLNNAGTRAIEPRLAVAANGGEPLFWGEKWRTLRYAVVRSTFRTKADYDSTIEAMRGAARDWERACPACGIRLEHAKNFDKLTYFSEFLAATKRDRQGYNDGLRFVVMRKNLKGFLALAFFPDAPANRRLLYVTPAFLKTLGAARQRGVMRHEFGHILGYRHEHIRLLQNGTTAIGICRPEGSMQHGQDWRALTAYDKKSIMHYPCTNASMPTLTLSRWDIEGHRKLYAKKPSVPNGNSLPVATIVKVEVPGTSYTKCRKKCLGEAGLPMNCTLTCTCQMQCLAHSDEQSCKTFCMIGGR